MSEIFVPKTRVVNFDRLINDLNRIRMCFGMPELAALPQAVPGDEDECVIAVAMSNGWKAEVSETIVLYWDDPQNIPSTEVLNAIQVALENQRFEFQFSIDGRYRDGEYVPEFAIKMTNDMQNLIHHFDNYKFPHLMNDESLFERAEFIAESWVAYFNPRLYQQMHGTKKQAERNFRETYTLENRKAGWMIFHALEERVRVSPELAERVSDYLKWFVNVPQKANGELPEATA